MPASIVIKARAKDIEVNDGIAKVEFYQGTTLLATVTTAPYTYTWSNPPAGSHVLTAQATDTLGAQTVSAARTITVQNNVPPTVRLGGVKAGTYALPTTLTLSASAAGGEINTPVTQVEFLANDQVIATLTEKPYRFAWVNPATGSYALTARATDSQGLISTSTPVQVRIDASSIVTLTNPSAGTVVIAPASLTLTANATDSDGVANVAFFQNGNLIGTATSAPYAVPWSNVPAGDYTLTAVATDTLGIKTPSAPINVSVVVNSAPQISLTSPEPNQSMGAPASIVLSANATDADNNLAKVAFYQNGTLLQTLLAEPYTTTWDNVPQGTYILTAIATDALGAQTTTAPITITVTAAQAAVYYIHADQLNTPRLITDEANTIVWRNLPTTEPFGNSPVEEDPNNTGKRFIFNLRFPGQYADRETNTNYNYFRDYDPLSGRYVQSDPIGLQGGINTYAYVGGNPLSYTDPTGESVWLPFVIGGALLTGFQSSSFQNAAANAAQYWANLQVQTGNPLYAIPGALATLADPCNAATTATVLGVGAAAGGYLGRPFWQYYPAGNPAYSSPWITRGSGWSAPYAPGPQAASKLGLPPWNPGTAVRPVNPSPTQFVGGPTTVKPYTNPAYPGYLQPGGGSQYRIGGWPR
jgi:RHS repeat-associated protein